MLSMTQPVDLCGVTHTQKYCADVPQTSNEGHMFEDDESATKVV